MANSAYCCHLMAVDYQDVHYWMDTTSCGGVSNIGEDEQENEAKVSVQEQLWVGIDYFFSCVGGYKNAFR